MTEPDVLALYEDAAFYDLEFAAREHEIPFYVRWAERSGGPVLEVACGSGRLTLPIAERGVEIVGLDLSTSMLARARDKAASRGLAVDWVHADASTMALGRRFALVFAATNAVQHLCDAAQVSDFLRAARDHLAEGGRLIVDVMNPSVRKLSRGADAPYHMKTFALPDGQKVEVEACSHYLDDLQQLRFTLRYRSGGRLLREKHVAMRCFFPEELLALCRAAGLEIEERFGDYDGRRFAAGAPKQILVCRAC